MASVGPGPSTQSQQPSGAPGTVLGETVVSAPAMAAVAAQITHMMFNDAASTAFVVS